MLQDSLATLPARGAPSLSKALREGTQAAHAQIEANPVMRRLMAPDLRRGEYRDILARLYGYHAPVEAALGWAAPLLPAALDLPRRVQRAPLLVADLAALGLPPTLTAALPRCPEPGIATVEAAWGTLYVLEGATLGGQLIARHLAATLAIGPANGAAAMVPHGHASGALWREFRSLLDAAGAEDGLDQAAVLDAARQAFGLLDAWMAPAGR